MRAFFLVALLLATAPIGAAGDELSVREVWVPEKDLVGALERMPKAVSLTREQYRRLLEDAAVQGLERPAEEKAPLGAVVTGARFSGVVKGDVIEVLGKFSVRVFEDGWNEVAIGVDVGTMGSVDVDGDAVFRSIPAEGHVDTALLVRGKGEHEVAGRFFLPVTGSGGERKFVVRAPGVVAGVFELELPEGVELRCAAAAVEVEGRTARITLPAEACDLEVELATVAGAGAAVAAVVQKTESVFSYGATRALGTYRMKISAPISELSEVVTVEVGEGAVVRSVDGKGLMGWELGERGEIVARFDLADGRELEMGVTLEVPTLGGGEGSGVVAMPLLKADVATRAEGRFSVRGDAGVVIREIVPGTESVFVAPGDGEVAAFGYAVSGDPVRVTVEREKTVWVASCDTGIVLGREAIKVERTVAVDVRAGELFGGAVRFGNAGEEVVSMSCLAGKAPVMREIEGGVSFDWGQEPMVRGERATLLVESRREPEGWDDVVEVAKEVGFSATVIDRVENLSGYVAVSADESLVVETLDESGMERRDGRVTPVKGALAWFRQGDYDLNLRVSPREAELLANVEAYVLPLFNTVEIEGEIELGVRYSPIEEVVVGLPVEVAPLFRLDSELVASSALDEASGEWTLRFARAVKGEVALRFRMTLPMQLESGEDGAVGRRFAMELPVLRVAEAARLEGAWMVEANTDTELAFEVRGLDEIDSLRVPEVAGYEPRHRVIAAYQYRGDGYGLVVRGTRHVGEVPVTTVVERMRLVSVVTAEGVERHQVTMGVRTSGDQFLDVGLPEGASVWSLAVDGVAVKPVFAGTGRVRIPMPEGGSQGRVMPVRVVYERRGEAWDSRGGGSLVPPTLAENVPLLETRWNVFLPDGYSYDGLDANLTVVEREEHGALVGYLWEEMAGRDWEFEMFAEESAREAMASLDKELRAQQTSVEQARVTMLKLMEDYGIVDLQAGSTIASMDTDGEPVTTAPELYRLSVKDKDQAQKDIETNLKIAEQNFANMEASKDQKADESISNRTANLEYAEAKRDYLEKQRLLEQIEETYMEGRVAGQGSIQVASDAVVEGADIIDPANSAEDRARVAQVERLMVLADGQFDLGIYDDARGTLNEVLRMDRYHTGARRQLEAIEQKIAAHHGSSRDNTRANMLRQVDERWESSVPAAGRGDGLVTRTYKVPPTFLTAAEADEGADVAADPFADPGDAGEGAALSRRTSTKDILAAAGITFPEGATAYFDKEKSQLVIRNTAENIDLVGSFMGDLRSSGSQVETFEVAVGETVTGLMPLMFDLPEGGKEFVLEGMYGAGALEFDYVAWEAEVQRGWMWMLVGAGLFLVIGRRRPVFVGLLGGILLTAVAVGLEGQAELANGVLVGWATACGLVICCRVARALGRIQKEGGADEVVV